VTLLNLYLSANRDGDVFDDPHEFRVDAFLGRRFRFGRSHHRRGPHPEGAVEIHHAAHQRRAVYGGQWRGFTGEL
jgi:hypothetical protein